MYRLRETEGGGSFTFAGTGHVGTTEDGKEVKFVGELVVGELDRPCSRWLPPEGIGPVGELIDGIGKYLSLESSGVKA